MAKHSEDSKRGCLHTDWRYLDTGTSTTPTHLVVEEIHGCKHCTETKRVEIQRVRRTN